MVWDRRRSNPVTGEAIEVALAIPGQVSVYTVQVNADTKPFQHLAPRAYVLYFNLKVLQLTGTPFMKQQIYLVVKGSWQWCRDVRRTGKLRTNFVWIPEAASYGRQSIQAARRLPPPVRLLDIGSGI